MFSFTVDVLTADNFNFSGGCIKLRSWLHLQRLLILGPVWLVLAGAGPSARLRQFALLLAKGILSVFVSVDAIVHLAVGGRTRPNSVLVVSLVVVSVHLDAHGVLLRLIEELAGHVVALCGRQWSICLMQINCVVVSRPWSEASLATTSDWVACFSFLTRYGTLLREEIHVSTLWISKWWGNLQDFYEGMKCSFDACRLLHVLSWPGRGSYALHGQKLVKLTASVPDLCLVWGL